MNNDTRRKQHEKTVWTDNAELPRFKTLDGDKKTDVLIIGGGLCGLLCAYRLQQAGVDYIGDLLDNPATGKSKVR